VAGRSKLIGADHSRLAATGSGIVPAHHILSTQWTAVEYLIRVLKAISLNVEPFLEADSVELVALQQIVLPVSDYFIGGIR